jgi:nitrate reductase beta subunit
VGYVVAIEIRNALIDLGIDTEKYESTKVFMQAVPYKTLYYGMITKEAEPELLKFPSTNVGLEREFVFVFDCAKHNPS